MFRSLLNIDLTSRLLLILTRNNDDAREANVLTLALNALCSCPCVAPVHTNTHACGDRLEFGLKGIGQTPYLKNIQFCKKFFAQIQL